MEDDSVPHSSSPLLPAARSLNWLHLVGGFPLVVRDPFVSSFSFRRRELFRCLLLPFALLLSAGVAQNILMTSVASLKSGNSTILNITSRECQFPCAPSAADLLLDLSPSTSPSRLSPSEAHGPLVLLVISLLGMTFNMIAFRCSDIRLSNLIQAISSAGGGDSCLPDEYHDLWRSHLRLAALILSFSTAGGAFASTFAAAKASGSDYQTIVVLFLLTFLVCVAGSVTLVAVGCLLLVLQVLGACRILGTRLSSALSYMIQTQNFMNRHLRKATPAHSLLTLNEVPIVDQTRKEDSLVMRCYHLIDVVESAEALLGPFIIVELTLCCFLGPIFAIFFMMNSSHYAFVLWLSLALSQWLLRSLSLFVAGQGLKEEFGNMRKHLEACLIANCDRRPPPAHYRLLILIDKCHQINIRPCAGFITLDARSGMAATAMLAVYAALMAQMLLLK